MGIYVNNPSTPNAKGLNGGSNVFTDASAITIAAEDGKTTGTFMNKINKESPVGENIVPNGGSNVVTGDSASTTFVEDSQTPGTRKLFAY